MSNKYLVLCVLLVVLVIVLIMVIKLQMNNRRDNDTYINFNPNDNFIQLANLKVNSESLEGYPQKQYLVDCKRACEKDTSCKAFMFNETQRSCDLKSELKLLEKNNNNFSSLYVKKIPRVDDPKYIPLNFVRPTNEPDSYIGAITNSNLTPCLDMVKQYNAIGMYFDSDRNKCSVFSKIDNFTYDPSGHTYLKAL